MFYLNILHLFILRVWVHVFECHLDIYKVFVFVYMDYGYMDLFAFKGFFFSILLNELLGIAFTSSLFFLSTTSFWSCQQQSLKYQESCAINAANS